MHLAMSAQRESKAFLLALATCGSIVLGTHRSTPAKGVANDTSKQKMIDGF
jgi:hypothetical protein